MNDLLSTWWKGGGDRGDSPVLGEERGRVIQVNRYSSSVHMCSRLTKLLMQRSRVGMGWRGRSKADGELAEQSRLGQDWGLWDQGLGYEPQLYHMLPQ